MAIKTLLLGLSLLGPVLLHPASLHAQSITPTPPAPSSTLQRRYEEGEKVAYKMQGMNQGHERTIRYTADANATVHNKPDQGFVEEVSWSNLVVNDEPVALSPSSVAFRENLSLAPEYRLTIPDLSKVQPILIGPITDLLTFYADVQLALKQSTLHQAGDHVYFKHGIPNSWADGTYIVVGQDAVDFDITLLSLDQATQVATIVVRHVPPAESNVKLPADWMNSPVADTNNNWVEVEKIADGKYTAAVGKETFETVIAIAIPTGRILSASMENPVDVVARECQDAALTVCAAPSRYQIMRKITMEEQAIAPAKASQ